MKHDKQHYRDLPVAKQYGFTWGGFDHDTNKHFFQKAFTHVPIISQDKLDAGWQPVPETRYKLVECWESALDEGNLEFFFKHGYTRA